MNSAIENKIAPSNEALKKSTVEAYTKKFGTAPEVIISSPGRINIIGEHIDYNDGYVLPAAIDKVIYFAMGRNNSTQSTILALDLDEETIIDLQADMEHNPLSWSNYLRGVLGQIKLKGYSVGGVNCAFSSNIPIGSGLSSSAALECGFLFGHNEMFRLGIKPIDIALMGQKAEHWVGINCGIMDQFASVMGKKDSVIKIDCKTLEFEYHNANFKDYSLILFDSNVKHSLGSSAYNTRVKECAEGISTIKNAFPEVKNFRDCTIEQVESVKDKLSDEVYRRTRFVVNEIKRVALACEALDRGDIVALGALMYATHEGLSKDYEVSCEELDMIVDTLKKEEAVIGSRLMGGGFGGCTINLIKKGFEEPIKEKLKATYFKTFGIELKIYDVNISDGTSLVK